MELSLVVIVLTAGLLGEAWRLIPKHGASGLQIAMKKPGLSAGRAPSFKT
jgi:hypothetical protein